MNCEECREYCPENELTAEEQYECDMLGDFVDRILDSQGCPNCIFEALMDLYYIGKEDGYDDCEENLMEFLDR
jgi:hypothetical protein